MIWRSSKVPLRYLLGLACSLLCAMLLLEFTAKVTFVPDYAKKVAAAETMQRGIELIRQEIQPIDPLNDPNHTGLIGEEFTEITTTLGSLLSKRTSTNPDFVVVIMNLMQEAGVQAGDHVAIGASGSFPALNLAALIAVEALGAEPVMICSLGASTWGANRIGWTWLEMERFFYEHGVILHRSVAVSLGGGNDRGEGFWGQGLELMEKVIVNDYVPFINEASIAESFQAHIQTYLPYHPVAFINIGGAQVNLGDGGGGHMFSNGLLTQVRAGFQNTERGMIHYFLEKGVPVVNLLNIPELATRSGLPLDPVPLPEPGRSGVYYIKAYSPLSLFCAFLIPAFYLTWLLLATRREH